MKEFNLSDESVYEGNWDSQVYLERDVKEFIKRLKKKFIHGLELEDIDKLAGEKLK